MFLVEVPILYKPKLYNYIIVVIDAHLVINLLPTFALFVKIKLIDLLHLIVIVKLVMKTIIINSIILNVNLNLLGKNLNTLNGSGILNLYILMKMLMQKMMFLNTDTLLIKQLSILK